MNEKDIPHSQLILETCVTPGVYLKGRVPIPIFLANVTQCRSPPYKNSRSGQNIITEGRKKVYMCHKIVFKADTNLHQSLNITVSVPMTMKSVSREV